jgi:hypothetical protein
MNDDLIWSIGDLGFGHLIGAWDRRGVDTSMNTSIASISHDT